MSEFDPSVTGQRALVVLRTEHERRRCAGTPQHPVRRQAAIEAVTADQQAAAVKDRFRRITHLLDAGFARVNRRRPDGQPASQPLDADRALEHRQADPQEEKNRSRRKIIEQSAGQASSGGTEALRDVHITHAAVAGTVVTVVAMQSSTESSRSSPGAKRSS